MLVATQHFILLLGFSQLYEPLSQPAWRECRKRISVCIIGELTIVFAFPRLIFDVLSLGVRLGKSSEANSLRTDLHLSAHIYIQVRL